jgi:hypothetical protein
MIPLGFEEGETFPIGYDFMTVQGGVQVCYVSTWAHKTTISCSKMSSKWIK